MLSSYYRTLGDLNDVIHLLLSIMQLPLKSMKYYMQFFSPTVGAFPGNIIVLFALDCTFYVFLSG